MKEIMGRDGGELARLSALSGLKEVTFKSRVELFFGRLARWGVGTYLATIVVLTYLAQFEGDRWWFATAILFGPKWFALLPLTVLVPLAAVIRIRLLIPLAMATLLVLFGVMGLCVPWPWNAAKAADGQVILSVLTCNVQGNPDTGKELWQSVHATNPDVIALQEMGAIEPSYFPDGWHVVREGGLAIASPYAIRDPRIWKREEPPSPWPPVTALYALVELPSGPIGVCNVHLTSPHDGLAEVIDRKTLVSPSRSEWLTELNYWRSRESETLSNWIRELPQVDVILGDFNLPVQSQIYRRWWQRYNNAFSLAGSGFGYTRWACIRDLVFGVRIDHVLLANGWAALNCEVGPPVGSDHLPVVATLVLPDR